MGSEYVQGLMSLPDVAAELDLHRATVNDMVLTRRLKAVRIGPHWYVHRDDVERFKHSYQRPKNAPKRRSRQWAESWRAELLGQIATWHSANAEELDRVVELHIGNIRKYLHLLEEDGLVARDAYGYWTLTDAGLERVRHRSIHGDVGAA